MADTIEIKAIGFSGFYGGIWDQGDNEYNALQAEIYCSDTEGLDKLQLLDDWGFINTYRNDVAQEYAEQYIEAVNETLNVNLKLKFQTLSSPKEYNFETDKIFCTVEIESLRSLCDRLVQLAKDPDNYKYLKERIKKCHTSCSGFWSWMSNDVDKWLEFIYDGGNDHYIAYLIGYLMEALGEDPKELNGRIYQYVEESTGLHEILPATQEAKEEYELFQKYGTIYTDWAEEHPKRYETRLSFPCFKETPWDEYEATFLEYGEPERLRREMMRNHPVIPGLE